MEKSELLRLEEIEVGSGNTPGPGVACAKALRHRKPVHSCTRRKVEVQECGEKRGAQEGRDGSCRGCLMCRAMVRGGLPDPGTREALQERDRCLFQSSPGSEWGRELAVQQRLALSCRLGCGRSREGSRQPTGPAGGLGGGEGLQRPCPGLWPEPLGRCWWDFSKVGTRGQAWLWGSALWRVCSLRCL